MPSSIDQYGVEVFFPFYWNVMGIEKKLTENQYASMFTTTSKYEMDHCQFFSLSETIWTYTLFWQSLFEFFSDLNFFSLATRLAVY